MVTLAEHPCYTLINTFDDSSEVPNEQQLKHDLGEFNLLIALVLHPLDRYNKHFINFIIMLHRKMVH